MSKRAKIVMATAFTALVVGGAAPGAFGQEQRSVGTTAYRTVTSVTESRYGATVVRVVDRTIEAALQQR